MSSKSTIIPQSIASSLDHIQELIRELPKPTQVQILIELDNIENSIVQFLKKKKRFV